MKMRIHVGHHTKSTPSLVRVMIKNVEVEGNAKTRILS